MLGLGRDLLHAAVDEQARRRILAAQLDHRIEVLRRLVPAPGVIGRHRLVEHRHPFEPRRSIAGLLAHGQKLVHSHGFFLAAHRHGIELARHDVVFGQLVGVLANQDHCAVRIVQPFQP